MPHALKLLWAGITAYYVLRSIEAVILFSQAKWLQYIGHVTQRGSVGAGDLNEGYNLGLLITAVGLAMAGAVTVSIKKPAAHRWILISALVAVLLVTLLVDLLVGFAPVGQGLLLWQGPAGFFLGSPDFGRYYLRAMYEHAPAWLPLHLLALALVAFGFASLRRLPSSSGLAGGASR